MKAIILAGGGGTRLELVDIPKPMYKLSSKPILEHNILLLRKHNILDLCFAIHHMSGVIKDYFEDGGKWGVKIQYSLEKEPLGTSGGLKEAEWFFDSDPFFVVYGDNYTNINLSEMSQFHKAHKPTATIAVFDPEKSLNSRIAGGVVNLDKENSIISFTEGKKRNLDEQKRYVNAGVYILEKTILNEINPKIFSDFGKDIFPKLLSQKKILKGYLTNSFVIAIDTKEALEIAQQVASSVNVEN